MKNTSLYIGWGTSDITPTGEVPLYGQYYERISTHIQSNLYATACAFESQNAGGSREQSIMISIDLLWCTTAIQEAVRLLVSEQLLDFDVQKLFIFATHTHSGPEPLADNEYGKFLVAHIAEAAVKAWKSRAPSGGISSTIAYVPVGHNRRTLYSDGTAEMYGEVNRDDFIGIEGPEDSSMDLLFCWNEQGNLEGIIINVPCPAQVTEAKSFVSADYWNEVRQCLQKRFSNDLYILAQCGAAGDLSPRDLTRGYKAGEPNMWEVEGMVEIGKRIDSAVAVAYERALTTIEKDVIFNHIVEVVEIPFRKVTKKAYENSLSIVQEIRSREPEDSNSPDTAWNRFLTEIKVNEKIKKYGPWDNKKSDYAILRKKELEVQQYKTHMETKFYQAEIHVIRLGKIAFASNPFELFVDYGFMIKGRSQVKQTFVIQMSCDYADYLPTERALQGGGYSAMSTSIGPDGGEILVNNTVRLIRDLFK